MKRHSLATALLVAALTSACRADPPAPAGPPPVRLAGVAIGTAGSFRNSGNDRAKPFATPGGYFDGPTTGGAWCGLDLGGPATIQQITFAPRPGWAGRMVGGAFQGSTTADFHAGISNLYAVTAPPPAIGQTVASMVPGPFRYVRYVGPPGGYCNVGPIAFAGVPPVGVSPSGPTASPTDLVLTPTPAPTPTAPPATFVTGCGSAAAAAAVYHAGQAPCVGWFDARGISATRTDRRLWHLATGAAPIPDPRHAADPARYPGLTVDPDNSRTGTVVAALYDQPGTYAVTCDVTHPDGTVQTYAASVVVDAGTRPHYYFGPAGNDANAGTSPDAPLASAARFALFAGRGGCRITLLPGTTLAPTSISPGSSLVVDGLPDAAGKPPVLTSPGYCLFNSTKACHDVLIRGVRFDSAGTPQVSHGVTWSKAPTLPHARAEAVDWSGTNGALVDCELGCLIGGAQQDAGDGFAVLDCRQTDPLSINGQVLACWGGSRTCFAGNTLLGAINEAVVRFDGPGSGTGASVEQNWVAQTNPVPGDKPAIDVRDSNGMVIAGNAVINSDARFSTTINTTATADRDLLYVGNVHRDLCGLPVGVQIEMADRVAGASFVGNDVDMFKPGVWAMEITTPGTGGVSDVAFEGNVIGRGQVSLHLAGTVPGLVADVVPGTAAK